MKRVFPYYTWIRKNAPLQLQAMMENLIFTKIQPKYFIVLKL